MSMNAFRVIIGHRRANWCALLGKEYLCSKLFSVVNSCLVGLRLHGVFPMSFVMFVHILLVQLQLEQLYWGDIMGIASNRTRWHNVTAKPLLLSGSYNQKQVSLCNVSYMHSIGSHKPSLLYGPQPSIAHPHLSPSTPCLPFTFKSHVFYYLLYFSLQKSFLFSFSHFFLVLASATSTPTLKNIFFYWNTIAACDIK